MLWPSQLYTASQCRELDRLAIASGIDGYELMCRAGRAAFNVLLRQWSLPEHIHIVCGTGNNGGDGLVIARLARERGLKATVYLCGSRDAIKNEAQKALFDADAAGVEIQVFAGQPVPVNGVMVDAFLGTGLQGSVRADAARAIEWINSARLPVLAVDIPSGLCADSGCVLGAAVEADKTITFIAAKRGLFTGEGSHYSGQVLLDDLSVPPSLFAQVGETVAHYTLHELLGYLPKRPRNAHKGMYGHVLVVGGNYGMAGAAMMAGESAARAGAGLTSIATQPEHVSAMLARHPEIMVHGVVSGQELDPLLEKPTVIVIGPGLGQTPWSEQMLQKVMDTGLPLVLDADALNIISSQRMFPGIRRDNWVLTPHPGEAARLLNCTTTQVNNNRFAAVRALQEQYGGTVVLKGAGSLVCSAEGTILCSYGNPGMASGGMGDLLSGLIAGLAAQKISLQRAATLAVALHARAADQVVASSGECGLLATDLLDDIRYLLNGKT